MTTCLFILLALAVAGMITEMIAAATAPLGYQDDDGFHFGSERPSTPGEYEGGQRG